MAMKPTESNSSVGETKGHVVQLPYTSHLTDQVDALSRKVFLKFDFLLVLPMLVMFCEY